ncbi:MAG TPA: phospholipase D-like domain-containing protein [Candidatus Nanoarchaeia archaeon]|nr:phospholipase D-like domain-containing protein [Candidatus Nanoarchaeia archaeon]
MRGYWAFFLLLAGCIIGLFAGIPEESGIVEAYFCDKVDCMALLREKTASGQVYCAMYHADKGFLEGAKLVVDEEHPLPGAVKEFGSGLMHNKFCVIDGRFVWTGSWNPSQKMTIPNNVVFIESKTLAEAYKAEFDELYKKVFHGGSSYPGLVKLNGHLVEAYFCPEDDCQERVLGVLKDAKSSIHFMTYAFTDDEIGDLLLEKSKSGIDVRGVFDPRKDKFSEYEKLKDISAIEKVHHKVFVIDGNTVITGSYNPSRNADERNDENVIIIRDFNIAEKFEEEFESLFD